MISRTGKALIRVIMVLTISIGLSPFLFVAHAQNTVNPPSSDNTVRPPESDNTVGPPAYLRNPLGEDSTLETFFAQLLEVLIIIAIPIVVFFIIYAGFLYVTAGGSEDKIKKATSAFTWAIVGGVLILGAQVLTDVIRETVNAFQ